MHYIGSEGELDDKSLSIMPGSDWRDNGWDVFQCRRIGRQAPMKGH